MKIFAIKSDDTGNKELGYLIYYEKTKEFYIELPSDADEWTTPLILSSFAKRGQHTINSYWSRVWVQQRIIPPDRQNIGSILKENGLDSYDEYSLLTLAEGRCAQDDYYIEPISIEKLPNEITNRFSTRVRETVPLEDKNLIVFFHDGSARKCDIKQLCTGDRFIPILNNEKLFSGVRVQTDGYGVTWGPDLDISADKLYSSGEKVPLSLQDFHRYAKYNTVDTAGACGLLKCSRQNINDLVKRGKLHPLRSSPSGMLFLVSELRQRLWE